MSPSALCSRTSSVHVLPCGWDTKEKLQFCVFKPACLERRLGRRTCSCCVPDEMHRGQSRRESQATSCKESPRPSKFKGRMFCVCVRLFVQLFFRMLWSLMYVSELRSRRCLQKPKQQTSLFSDATSRTAAWQTARCDAVVQCDVACTPYRVLVVGCWRSTGRPLHR
jgi:hypothetical protein